MTAPLAAFSGALAHRRALLTQAECARWTADVYAARASWVGSFEASQFTLGRAWYTHLEENQSDDYFRAAAASDALVRRAAPGLQERMLGLLSQLVGAPVERRAGWCGPGVHIFPAGGWVALKGGVVHFDTEGLSDEMVAAGPQAAPALTVVAMLQPPESGGGLRVWTDVRYAGSDEVEDAEKLPSRLADYAVGDVVAIDARCLHQIQPFGGARDRVSATAHVVRADGAWLAWF